jgi:hypothetical protein
VQQARSVRLLHSCFTGEERPFSWKSLRHNRILALSKPESLTLNSDVTDFKKFYVTDSICPIQAIGALLGRIRSSFGSGKSACIIYSPYASSKEDHERFFVNGNPFDLKKLRDGVKAAICDTQEMIKEITKAEFLVNFSIHARAAVDDVDNAKPGYSFLTDPRNRKLATFCNEIIAKICADSSFVQVTENQEIISIGSRAAAFLLKVDAILRNVMFLIHCTSGQPARGTEFQTLQFVNTPEAMRNMFLNEGFLFTSISHSKTNTRTGQAKYIPRLLPKEVSGVILYYVAVLRPIQM